MISGAISGAISGGLFYGAGEIITAMKGAATLGVRIGIHAVAGAASGALNAAISGGDIGRAALVGGMSAGIAKGLVAKVPCLGDSTGPNAMVKNAVRHAAIGAIVGGGVAAAMGMDISQGAMLGGMTAGIAYLCNDSLHEFFNFVEEIKANPNFKSTADGKYQRRYGDGETVFEYESNDSRPTRLNKLSITAPSGGTTLTLDNPSTGIYSAEFSDPVSVKAAGQVKILFMSKSFEAAATFSQVDIKVGENGYGVTSTDMTKGLIRSYMMSSDSD